MWGEHDGEGRVERESTINSLEHVRFDLPIRSHAQMSRR